MKNIILVVILLGLISCSPKLSNTQNLTESECYNVEFVSAARIANNPKNNVSVVLLITPKFKEAFPPVLSMGLKYSIGQDGKETYVNLQNQQGTGIIQAVIYGETVEEKSPKIHSIIKDKINLNDYPDLKLLVFEFNDKIDRSVEDMGIVYGLWEKKKKNIRVEKKYYFKIETIE